MTSQPGLQTITIHIFTNMSKSKANQTMKLGQIIESWETFFLKDHKQNLGRESITWPFLQKSKLGMSLDQYSQVLFILF